MVLPSFRSTSEFPSNPSDAAQIDRRFVVPRMTSFHSQSPIVPFGQNVPTALMKHQQPTAWENKSKNNISDVRSILGNERDNLENNAIVYRMIPYTW